tara:strand:+ start:216 stop:821 length:606 start_codon:yes stop_codon:yes gene_type:complete
MIFNAIYFLLISNAAAASYTPMELFTSLDIDHNGNITPDELEEAILNMESVITIEKNECSCFSCDGTHYIGAEICDVYDNSGCLGAKSTQFLCYTTNVKKCECNTYSKNPYICKIPLTHSFVDFTEKGMNYDVKINKSNKVTYANTYKKTTNDDMWERSESSYQKGRNSAMDDIVDMANTIIIADAVGSLFSLALENKGPY